MFDPGRLAAVALRFGFEVPKVEGVSPELQAMMFQIAPRVRLRFDGRPSCALRTLFTEYATDSCRSSIVGHGRVVSEFRLPEREPVSEGGQMVAYVSHDEGKLWLLAKVVTQGTPSLEYVIPFRVWRDKASSFRLAVERMRSIHGICVKRGCGQEYTLQGVYSRIESFSLRLYRRYRQGSAIVSVASAGCPGAPGATSKRLSLMQMQLAYADFAYADEASQACSVRWVNGGRFRRPLTAPRWFRRAKRAQCRRPGRTALTSR